MGKSARRIPPVRPVHYSEQVVSWIDPGLKKETPDLAAQDGFRSVSDWIRSLIRSAKDRILRAPR